MSELAIIQKTYDLIKWYIPILNRLPKAFKFQFGDRIMTRLYDFLDTLLLVQYQSEKLNDLIQLNQSLVVLRFPNLHRNQWSNQLEFVVNLKIVDFQLYWK